MTLKLQRQLFSMRCALETCAVAEQSVGAGRARRPASVTVRRRSSRRVRRWAVSPPESLFSSRTSCDPSGQPSFLRQLFAWFLLGWSLPGFWRAGIWMGYGLWSWDLHQSKAYLKTFQANQGRLTGTKGKARSSVRISTVRRTVWYRTRVKHQSPRVYDRLDISSLPDTPLTRKMSLKVSPKSSTSSCQGHRRWHVWAHSELFFCHSFCQWAVYWVCSAIGSVHSPKKHHSARILLLLSHREGHEADMAQKGRMYGSPRGKSY